MLLRIAVFTLVACTAIGTALDHFLGTQSFSAAFLPGAFKSRSLTAESMEILSRRRFKEAIVSARNAVLTQPLSTEALIGLARSSAIENPKLSSETLLQAAALGWRGVTAQSAMIESGAFVGRWDVVALRLVALARLNELDAIDQSAFASADVRDYAPQIAPAFTQSGMAWFKFSKWLKDNGLERESDYVLTQTPIFQRKDDCAYLGHTAQELVRDRKILLAAELIESRCKSFLTWPSSSISIDQHFGDKSRGPFEWQVLPHSGVSFNITNNDGATRLEIRNADPLTRKFATKIVKIDKSHEDVNIYSNIKLKGGEPHDMRFVSVKCIYPILSNKERARQEGIIGSGRCPFGMVSIDLPRGQIFIDGDPS